MLRNPSAILFDQLIRLIMWIVILSTFRARQMWRDLRLCDARVYRPARKVQEILSAKSYLKQFFREQILSILSAFIFVRNPLVSNHYPCVEMIYEYVTTLTKLSLRSLAPGCKRHSISSSPNSSCPNFPNANDARYTILLSFYTSKFFATQTTWLFWIFSVEKTLHWNLLCGKPRYRQSIGKHHHQSICKLYISAKKTHFKSISKPWKPGNSQHVQHVHSMSMRFLLEISGCRAWQWEFAARIIGRAVEFPVLGTLQLQHEDLRRFSFQAEN